MNKMIFNLRNTGLAVLGLTLLAGCQNKANQKPSSMDFPPEDEVRAISRFNDAQEWVLRYSRWALPRGGAGEGYKGEEFGKTGMVDQLVADRDGLDLLFEFFGFSGGPAVMFGFDGFDAAELVELDRLRGGLNGQTDLNGVPGFEVADPAMDSLLVVGVHGRCLLVHGCNDKIENLN